MTNLSDLFKPQKATETESPQVQENSPQKTSTLEEKKSGGFEFIQEEKKLDEVDPKLEVLLSIENDIQKGLEDGVSIDIFNKSVILKSAVQAAKDVLDELTY